MDRCRKTAVAIGAATLCSLGAVIPSSSVAAAPPGAVVTVKGATIISAVIPAPVTSTYRSLLPGGIAPAADPPGHLTANRPSVKLNGLELVPVGSSAPIFESYAMLRARYCGRNGWYNRADGANSPLVKPLGDALGISKYPIDVTSGLGPDATHPEVWRSRAQLDGKAFVTLTWRRDPRKLARLLRKQPWQKAWLRGDGMPFKAPIWDAFPVPGQDGMLNWIDADRADSEDPPDWTNRVGVVTVKVRQDVDPARTYGDWMSLVPETVEVPGVLQRFTQGTSYVTVRRAAVGAC